MPGRLVKSSRANSKQMPTRICGTGMPECLLLTCVSMRLGVFCILDSECLMPSSTDQTCLSCSVYNRFIQKTAPLNFKARHHFLGPLEARSTTPSRTPRSFRAQSKLTDGLCEWLWLVARSTSPRGSHQPTSLYSTMPERWCMMCQPHLMSKVTERGRKCKSTPKSPGLPGLLDLLRCCPSWSTWDCTV